jgi:glycosyltransferase involved in cell wall biosynthesis
LVEPASIYKEDNVSLSSLSIVTQTYNEELIIRDIMAEIIKAGDSVTDNLEIVVVACNDSVDNTIDILRDMSRDDSRIRIIHQEHEDVGYGKAFKMGIFSAKNDYVFQTDADGQFDYTDLGRAVKVMPEYDYVHFNRRNRMDSTERKVIGWIFRQLIRLTVSAPDVDYDAAFKLFRRNLLDRFELRCASGVLVPEFVIKAHLVGARVYVGDTLHRPRAGGTAAWEIKPRWLPIVLPNPRIVLENLRDLVFLRREIHAFSARLRSERSH